MTTLGDAEVDLNYAAFTASLPSMLKSHAGKFVLIHQSEMVEYFDNALNATLVGLKKFGAGAFSVQEVTASAEHLGFYSYVGGAGPY